MRMKSEQKVIRKYYLMQNKYSLSYQNHNKFFQWRIILVITYVVKKRMANCVSVFLSFSPRKERVKKEKGHCDLTKNLWCLPTIKNDVYKRLFFYISQKNSVFPSLRKFKKIRDFVIIEEIVVSLYFTFITILTYVLMDNYCPCFLTTIDIELNKCLGKCIK